MNATEIIVEQNEISSNGNKTLGMYRLMSF